VRIAAAAREEEIASKQDLVPNAAPRRAALPPRRRAVAPYS